jgi:hypothetical protein
MEGEAEEGVHEAEEVTHQSLADSDSSGKKGGRRTWSRFSIKVLFLRCIMGRKSKD